MQLKITPLNLNSETREYEPAPNVSYAQLHDGKLRLRVGFLPMDERQHELIAELLPDLQARIVRVSADPLLRIERQDHPAHPPKVHMVGQPLWMDIEIGYPRGQYGRPAPEKTPAGKATTAPPSGEPAPPANRNLKKSLRERLLGGTQATEDETAKASDAGDSASAERPVDTADGQGFVSEE